MATPVTIAVIDDDADFQSLMEVALREHGYRVVGFPVGEGAVQVIREAGADLVILDILLPGVSGYRVLNDLLTNPETTSIPVLVCTGASWSIEERERVFGEMGVSVLPKPFQLETLVAEIERLLLERRRGSSVAD